MLNERSEWESIKDDVRRDKEVATFYLLQYDNELQSYRDQRRADLGSIGDSAADLIRVAEYDRRHDAFYWLRAVGLVQAYCGAKRSLILNIRRSIQREALAGGQHAWVIKTQMRFIDEMYRNNKGDRTAYVSERQVRACWADLVGRTIDIYLRLKIREKKR